MASIVEDIIEGSRTIATTQLGNAWQELRHFYEVEKNDIRSAAKGFGVRPLGASPTTTTTNSYTVDQGFEIILTDTITRAEGDNEREVVLFEMYNQIDEIFKDLQNTKVNGTANVLLVSDPSISEPEFFDDNKFIVLRMQYIVKYRGSTL